MSRAIQKQYIETVKGWHWDQSMVTFALYRPINNRSKMVANQESLQVIFYPCVASHDAYTRHSVASSLEGEDGHLIHPRNRSSILKGCTTPQRSLGSNYIHQRSLCNLYSWKPKPNPEVQYSNGETMSCLYTQVFLPSGIYIVHMFDKVFFCASGLLEYHGN